MSSKEIPRIEPFNPLDKQNLGESVAEALLATPAHPLPPEPFIGAGVYALYYLGDFSAYHLLVEHNKQSAMQFPIYVGKAVPAGARKGGLGLGVEHGQALQKRLTDHSKSITAAINLNLEDFICRFLVVDDIWIPLAESMLIERFKPVWNHLLDGFGNHDPGKGRHQGIRPFWDTLHPGREWADKLKPNSETPETLRIKVQAYIKDLIHSNTEMS